MVHEEGSDKLLLLHSQCDAHARERAMRGCGHYLQAPGQQSHLAVEMRLEFNELLAAAVVVGVVAA
jgi:hypothetical protein